MKKEMWLFPRCPGAVVHLRLHADVPTTAIWLCSFLERLEITQTWYFTTFSNGFQMFFFFFFLYLLIMPLVCFSLSIFPSVFYCRVQNANVHHVELMRDFRPLEWLHKRVNSHFFIPAKKQTWPEWVCMTKEHREGKHGVSWHALPIHIQYRKRYHLFTRWKLSTTGLCFQAVSILLLGS